jgi:hypothetical protein
VKTNTTDVKRLLFMATKAMPADHALNEARYHLKACLGHVEKVESHRKKREEVLKNEEKRIQLKNTVLPQMMQESLAAIDAMIEAEKQKLETIKRNKPNESEDGVIVD